MDVARSCVAQSTAVPAGVVARCPRVFRRWTQPRCLDHARGRSRFVARSPATARFPPPHAVLAPRSFGVYQVDQLFGDKRPSSSGTSDSTGVRRGALACQNRPGALSMSAPDARASGSDRTLASLRPVPPSRPGTRHRAAWAGPYAQWASRHDAMETFRSPNTLQVRSTIWVDRSPSAERRAGA